MNRVILLKVTAFIIFAAILSSATACIGGSTGDNSTQTPTVEVTKVKPSVEKVDVVTTGTQDKYYAILNITVKNDGSGGTVIITGSITQGTQSPVTSEMSVYLNGNSKQVIPMVLPLKWGAGEPTAQVEVQIP